jgi:hypothetical protein
MAPGSSRWTNAVIAVAAMTTNVPKVARVLTSSKDITGSLPKSPVRLRGDLKLRGNRLSVNVWISNWLGLEASDCPGLICR